MTASLPALADFDSYGAWRTDPERWLPVAGQAGDMHCLPIVQARCSVCSRLDVLMYSSVQSCAYGPSRG
jgi:hypothetical protein